MRIMWMNLVQISPFSNGLFTQQRFRVTHNDFGTAHGSRYVHISSKYFAKSKQDLECSNSFSVRQQ